MSVTVPGFASSAVFEQIKAGVEGMNEAEKKATLKRVNGVFEMVVKNAQGQEQSWTLDLKNAGTVTLGKGTGKPDIVISLADATFTDLAAGKLNGQKAFMQGKLKVKGQMMLATRLDAVLKSAQKAPAKPAAAAAAAPAAPTAGGIEVPGYESSKIFGAIKSGLDSASPAEKEGYVKKTKAIFQFDVKNASGKIQTWTLDLKNSGSIATGAGANKPDIVITVADKDFTDLAAGKLNGQKAFMQGKLKVKGQIMLATSKFFD
ncbi:hypothetical protein HK102_006900 [Quaeritorhiza haematococci]|nr:hypothetical protein HK102_006900 [Quaeritorhiza haematococci]